MSKIDEIRSLVEEVRDIIRADAPAEDAEARDAVRQEAADEIVDEIFEAKKKGADAHHGKSYGDDHPDKVLGKQKLKGHKPGAHHKFDHGGGSDSHASHAGGKGKKRKAARDSDGKPMKGKFKKKTGHSPYKRSRKIGAARTGVAEPTVRSWRGYWKCRKQGAYKQLCIGSNGERKKVRIKRGYKKKYNTAYRKWRSGASKFKKGKWTKSFKKG